MRLTTRITLLIAVSIPLILFTGGCVQTSQRAANSPSHSTESGLLNTAVEGHNPGSAEAKMTSVDDNSVAALSDPEGALYSDDWALQDPVTLASPATEDSGKKVQSYIDERTK